MSEAIVTGLGLEVRKDAELKQNQQSALEALKSGSTFPQAAEAAGVGRATVYRWVQSDPHFRAAYNLWQRELAESARARLLKLADRAVGAIERAVDRGDGRLAAGVLKDMGVLRERHIGMTDSNLLELQMQIRKHRTEQRIENERLRQLLAKMGVSPKEAERFIRERGRADDPAMTPPQIRGEPEFPSPDPFEFSDKLGKLVEQLKKEGAFDKNAGETNSETPEGVSHGGAREDGAQVI